MRKSYLINTHYEFLRFLVCICKIQIVIPKLLSGREIKSRDPWLPQAFSGVNPDNAKYFDKFGRTAGKAVRWCVRTATIPAVKWLVDFPFFPRPDTSRACADTVAGSHSFETQVTWTAGLLALVLALILSGGYFFFSYQHLPVKRHRKLHP